MNSGVHPMLPEARRVFGIPFLCPHERGSKKIYLGKLDTKTLHLSWGKWVLVFRRLEAGFQGTGGRKGPPCCGPGGEELCFHFPCSGPRERGVFPVEGRSLGHKPYISIQKESSGLSPPSSHPHLWAGRGESGSIKWIHMILCSPEMLQLLLPQLWGP